MKEKLNNKICEIEDVLLRYLPKREGYQKVIFDAMEYALMAGGKRIRPMFMNEVYIMCGGKDRALVEPFMAALEMIHTYSLIHDDLPAMDDDDYRRGRKTTHIVYGEAMGILAGDALLNYAYETAASAFDTGMYERVARALMVLMQKAGVYGMVGGQVVDVSMNGQIPDVAMLDFINKLKTAALLEAAFMIGGILAGAGDEEVVRLESIAANVGMAFQIQDDILDVTGTIEELGKPVNSDEKNGKTTYVQLCGMEKAKEDVLKYSREAEKILDELDTESDKTFVREMIDYLINRSK